MKRTPLYSHSRRSLPAAPVAPAAESHALDGAAATPTVLAAHDLPPLPTRSLMARLVRVARHHERRLWLLTVLLLALAGVWRISAPGTTQPGLDFDRIDHMMRTSIAERPLTPASTLAYAKTHPSVVRVSGHADAGNSARLPPQDNADHTSGVGSGVVILDNGTILTNLHVVLGARTIKVTFSDGLESEARLINVMPEHDLAVLQASILPDDLVPATLRSTAGLVPGDPVMAVGFPFDIGPSASLGVISGLKREFRSPEGKGVLSNLIQFDAAANPGNSGGPLVTMEGEVIGIVTAILNPTEQRVFVGIGFAVPIENAAAGVGMSPF